MEVKSIRLNNIGRFKELTVPLAPTPDAPSNITVLIGNNGAGKTSILRSLATSMSWLVSRLRTLKGSGSPIPEEVILNEASSGSVNVFVVNDFGRFSSDEADIESSCFNWTIAKVKKGKKGFHTSDLHEVGLLADAYKELLSSNKLASLPLIAFYPVERVVLDIPLKIKEKHTFLQLDGYDNSLNQGVDFRRFFEWFREREDAENESGISEEILNHLMDRFGRDPDFRETLQELNSTSRDSQLTAVRKAISSFMTGFNNLQVRRKPRLHMSIDKDGKTLNVLQLSQGEKSLMALVGDIARRLAMMNPSMDNPLEGDGVVLIDEVDMHLHPTWQRNIISKLASTFPNCQFIVTTHSPLVISECKDALVYSVESDGLVQVQSQYGQDANSVLLDVMNTHARNANVTKQISDILDLIYDGLISEARVKLADLSENIPSDNIELARLKLLLRKKELKSDKNI
ncbi:AAA family ATPase [Cobetia amphilecti]|uniref:AAA family ATPase n=1 Tax=Cobetia amphilecti TaxID=1055104 RepID=UPI001CDA6FFA|nr:AAA family ATPase [Cobetia amphilecti]UBU47705.1 AAA family ATPase [Cobetia amphilecti]